MRNTRSIYRLMTMLLTSIVMFAAPIAALQAQEATPAESTPVHSDATTAVRVLSIDGDTGDLTLLDGQSGDTLASYTAAGAPGFVVGAGSDSGETMLVNYFDGNKSVVLDTGIALHNHGDHMDLETDTPSIRATIDATGPAHFWIHDGHIAMVADGDNAIYLWNEEDIATNPAPTVIPLGIDEPDHGSIVIANDLIYMGYYGNGLVQTYSLDGELIDGELASCPGTHGEAVVGNTVLFACDEYVLLLDENGEAGQIPYPEGTDEPIRSNVLAATSDDNLVIGDSPAGLIVFDLENQSAALIEHDTAIMAIASTDSGAVALDSEGTLHGFSLETSEVTWSTPVATGHSTFPAEEANMFYPFIDTGAGNVYVADPGTGNIVVVNAETGEIANTINVGGRPARVVVVTASGVVH